METTNSVLTRQASDRATAAAQTDLQNTAAAVAASDAKTPSSQQSSAPEKGSSALAMAAAYASLGSRNSMVTDIVFGPNNQVTQIRVVDAVTRQVISKSPPDSIAHMQLEMAQYQEAAKNKLGST